MRESDMRKWHRRLGIAITFLIILQAGTGLMLTVIKFTGSPEVYANADRTSLSFHDLDFCFLETLHSVHTGKGIAGHFYRIAVGIGIFAMVVSGNRIYSKTKSRRG